jgi:hypothetical protein
MKIPWLFLPTSVLVFGLAACRTRQDELAPDPGEPEPSVVEGKLEWPEDWKTRNIRCVAFFHGREREDPWIMRASGIHRGDEVRVEARWSSGQLEAEIFGGWPGYDETTVSLSFAMDHPFAPHTTAKVSVYTDFGYCLDLADPTGDVSVQWIGGDDVPPEWEKNGWSGHEPAMVTFSLYGQYGGRPVCFHGAFALDPSTYD